MILSASRRTDIPAFYSEWFMNRLREGFVYVRNPKNYAQISEVALSPDNVDCIVFWTKDALPMLPCLDELDHMGYKYYFQFTITPYGRDIETHLREKPAIIETFKALSDRLGKERVVLRVDPILIAEKIDYTLDYHKRRFENLCRELSACTERIVISFIDKYRRISKNMQSLGMRELTVDEMTEIAEYFSSVASGLGLSLETCSEAIDLTRFGIRPTKCIDGDLIERIIGTRIRNKDVRDGNREHCGCMKSIDIGHYDTCVHGCLYCYANVNKEQAFANRLMHNPSSPLMLGRLGGITVKPRNERDTRSLR